MKKNKWTQKIFIIIILFAFFSTSCKKEDKDSTIVKGTVVNPKNNAPISDAKVYLDGKILSGGVYNDNYSEIASATSDASGNFEINTKFQLVSAYRIRTFKNNYFESSASIPSDKITKGGTYTTSLTLLPAAWVKLNINNVVNFADDEIQYRFASAPESCFDCCNNQFLVGVGSYHTTYKCRLPGDSYGKFYWTVKRSGVINPFTDSVYCVAFDTTVLNISY